MYVYAWMQCMLLYFHCDLFFFLHEQDKEVTRMNELVIVIVIEDFIFPFCASTRVNYYYYYYSEALWYVTLLQGCLGDCLRRVR